MESKNLIDLLKTNTEKMNFQQNMCFQMKNWSIAITVGIIGVAWKSFGADKALNIVAISIHLPILFFLVFLNHSTKNWMYYFIVFRERSKLLENTLIESNSNEPVILTGYYKYHTNNSYKNDINTKLIKKDFKKDTKDNFYIYLIGLTLISFIAMIVYELC